MDLGLRKKTVIVCAASKGLGKAIAMQFARESANVVICSRNEALLNQAAEDIRNTVEGASVLVVKADVTNRQDMKHVITSAMDHFGSVHVLVNNAGGPPPGGCTDISEDQWKQAIELNLMSAIRWSNEIVPMMRRQKWGRIVNVTSITIKQPLDNMVLSNTVRTGLIGFAKTLSRECAVDNVLVNNVCPGTTRTDRITQLIASRAERASLSVEEMMARTVDEIPMKRLGRPDEIANLVVFLGSEAASFMTGTSILADGGASRGLL